MPTHKYNRGVYAATMLVALKAMSGCDNANSTVGSTTGDTGQGGRGSEAVYIPQSSIQPSSGRVDESKEVTSQAERVSFHVSLAEVRHFEVYSRYQSMFDAAADGPATGANSDSSERSLAAGKEKSFTGAGAIGACLVPTGHAQNQDQD